MSAPTDPDRRTDRICATAASAAAAETLHQPPDPGRRRTLSAATVLLAALCPGIARPQSAYPDKPIRVVVGFAPGGGSDILLRTIAPALGTALGGSVVVENRPGAGGNLAMELVAKAPADGYTLLLGTPGLATNPWLYPSSKLEPIKDFAPIALVGSVQNVLIVRPTLDVSNVQDLLAMARANPGKLNYASPGAGTSLHLAAELLRTVAGINYVHVPYPGGAQALNDVIAGNVDLMFNVLPSALPQIRAGKVKALAVTGPVRAAALAEVPTMIEAGVAGYTATTWNGLLAPAGTPPEVVRRLNDAVLRVLAQPDIQQKYAGLGQDVRTSTPEEFATLIREESAKWRRIIETNGIRAQ